MTRKNILTIFIISGLTFFIACNDEKKDSEATTSQTSTTTEAAPANEPDGTNPKGIGPHQNVQLTHPLDQKMVDMGKQISDVKCTSCHKMTEEKLVGPGWKGVTDRRTPEWIMNFITNTDEMISKDTAAINMLEACLVKMPNQGLSEADARAVLEFMRKVDGKS